MITRWSVPWGEVFGKIDSLRTRTCGIARERFVQGDASDVLVCSAWLHSEVAVLSCGKERRDMQRLETQQKRLTNLLFFHQRNVVIGVVNIMITTF